MSDAAGSGYPVDSLIRVKRLADNATTVLAMEIERASAKIRSKGVADDDEDYALPVYAERIPLRLICGAPEPCPRLLPGVRRPTDLGHYRDGNPLKNAVLAAHRSSYASPCP